jgi:hypothetical protein
MAFAKLPGADLGVGRCGRPPYFREVFNTILTCRLFFYVANVIIFVYRWTGMD